MLKDVGWHEGVGAEEFRIFLVGEASNSGVSPTKRYIDPIFGFGNNESSEPRPEPQKQVRQRLYEVLCTVSE